MAWIHALSKDAITQRLQEIGEETTGTLEVLRTRMREFIRDNPENPTITSWAAAYSATPKTAAPTSTATTSATTSAATIALPPEILAQLTDKSKPIETVRKWNCRFSGKDLYAFIDRIQELKEAYNLSDSQLLQGIPEVLEKEPLDWYRNNRNTWDSWAQFISSLKTQFLAPNAEEELEDEIYSYKQKPDECVRQFVTNLQTLMRRKGGYSTEQQINRIYRNLKPEYQLHIPREDITSADMIVKRGERLEELERKIKNDANQRRQYTTNTPIATASTPYTRESCCWKCKQPGHSRRACPNPGRLFCSYCGKDNILTKSCKCPRQGNAKADGLHGDATRPRN